MTSDATLPERLLLDLRTDCNLRCPKCLLHGKDHDEEIKAAAIGTMNHDKVIELLDEVSPAQPLVQPSWWGEPLLAPRLREHITEMKNRDMPVCMNTNGLTLKEDLAEFFCQVELDSIFFSLDATTPETLIKTRGIDKLDKIERNLKMMLDVRGDRLLPRIGASFTVEESNLHELDEFVAKWTPVVDVVRVGYVYDGGKLHGIEVPEKREPCKLLRQTMPIRFNGDASMCCFDGIGEVPMGNVFRDGGVSAVWNGDRFNEVRRLHDEGRWDEIPACKDCNAWAGALYEETIEGDLMIRRSSQFTYYNRIDRLENWGDDLRGHQTPDKEKARAHVEQQREKQSA